MTPEERQEARAWLDALSTAPFGAGWCCEALNVEPATVRRFAERIEARQATVPREDLELAVESDPTMAACLHCGREIASPRRYCSKQEAAIERARRYRLRLRAASVEGTARRAPAAGIGAELEAAAGSRAPARRAQSFV